MIQKVGGSFARFSTTTTTTTTAVVDWHGREGVKSSSKDLIHRWRITANTKLCVCTIAIAKTLKTK
jgi:hypothetical protein